MSILKRSALALVASAVFAAPTMAQTTFTFSTRGCFFDGNTGCTNYNSFNSPTTYNFQNGASMTFTGVTNWSGTSNSTTGFLSLLNLGAFSFTGDTGNGATDFDFSSLGGNDLDFKLMVDFSAPVGVSPDSSIFTADITGKIKKNTSTGRIEWDFSTGTQKLTYPNGGGFKLGASDGGNSSSNAAYQSSYTIGGSIQCGADEAYSYQERVRINYQWQWVTKTGTRWADGACAGVSATGEVTTDTNVVPEPSTYALMAAGLAGLGVVARRRRQNG